MCQSYIVHTCNVKLLAIIIANTIDIRRERDGKRYVNSIDDPRFGQCFLLYFLQPMLLASIVLGYKLATELHVLGHSK